MNDAKTKNEKFSESQSLQVIKEMIKVSQRKLKNDGILLIIWGWIMTLQYLMNYLLSNFTYTYNLHQLMRIIAKGLPLVAVAYTLYHLYKEHRKVQTYIGISLRYVWFGLIACLSLTNLIIFNVTDGVNFELQHPIFMVFIAFSITITGGIIRYKPIVFGGVLFAVLAYIGSSFELQIQLLFESAAWFCAFVIPGHILFSKRNK